jgi:dTDP-4-amino-4,6-dideoxygalactose transaminase
MVTTDSRELFERVLSYRSLCCRTYGGSDKYLPIDEAKHPMGQEYWRLQFDDIGYNFRMIDAQAAVGSEQLKKLDGFNTRRIQLARAFRKAAWARSCLLGWTSGAHFPLTSWAHRRKPMEESDVGAVCAQGIKAWNHMPIHLAEPYRAQLREEGPCGGEGSRRFLSLPITFVTEEARLHGRCVAELDGDRLEQPAPQEESRSLYGGGRSRVRGGAGALGTDTDDTWATTMGHHLTPGSPGGVGRSVRLCR